MCCILATMFVGAFVLAALRLNGVDIRLYAILAPLFPVDAILFVASTYYLAHGWYNEKLWERVVAFAFVWDVLLFQLLAMLQDAAVINWHPAAIFAPVWLLVLPATLGGCVACFQGTGRLYTFLCSRDVEQELLQQDRVKVFAAVGMDPAQGSALVAASQRDQPHRGYGLLRIDDEPGNRLLGAPPAASRAHYIDVLVREQLQQLRRTMASDVRVL